MKIFQKVRGNTHIFDLNIFKVYLILRTRINYVFLHYSYYSIVFLEKSKAAHKCSEQKKNLKHI